MRGARPRAQRRGAGTVTADPADLETYEQVEYERTDRVADAACDEED